MVKQKNRPKKFSKVPGGCTVVGEEVDLAVDPVVASEVDPSEVIVMGPGIAVFC